MLQRDLLGIISRAFILLSRDTTPIAAGRALRHTAFRRASLYRYYRDADG